MIVVVTTPYFYPVNVVGKISIERAYHNCSTKFWMSTEEFSRCHKNNFIIDTNE